MKASTGEKKTRSGNLALVEVVPVEVQRRTNPITSFYIQ